jgi:hypothetical protein
MVLKSSKSERSKISHMAPLEWKRQKKLAWTWETFGLEIEGNVANCVLKFIYRPT